MCACVLSLCLHIQFLFFLWFDYSAFGLLLWAKSLQEFIERATSVDKHNSRRGLTIVEMLGLIIVPVQFWTAPLLSSYLAIDSRSLLLARRSHKVMYAMMMLLFPLVLRYVGPKAYSWRQVSILWLTGIGCGLVHHTPLFVFNMRGYHDRAALLVTLLTEWPALVFGVAVVEHVGGWVMDMVCRNFSLAASPVVKARSGREEVTSSAGRGAGTRGTGRGAAVLTAGLWLALALLMGPHLSGVTDKDAMALLIPEVPGQHMQTLGTAFLRARTCLVPR